MAPSAEEDFANELSHLSTDEEKMAIVMSYFNSIQTKEINGYLLPTTDNPSNPTASVETDPSPNFYEILQKHGLLSAFHENIMSEVVMNTAIKRAPCAHVQVERRWSCSNEGKLVCSGCRLVGYCSKVRHDSTVLGLVH
jgi:hypothetical protein